MNNKFVVLCSEIVAVCWKVLEGTCMQCAVIIRSLKISHNGCIFPEWSHVLAN